MKRSLRRTLPAAGLALAIALLAGANGAQQPADRKLYRWVDASGKVHYTDALPPEVVDKARAELSAATGMVRERFDRALTPEERVLAEAQARTRAEVETRVEQGRRSDEAKVSSFRSEDELRAAYAQRQAIIDDTLTSLQAAIDAQRGSMHQQLGLAGDAELADRSVPPRTIEIILDLRREVLNQEQALLLRSAEKQVLAEEMERLVVLFRERQKADLQGEG